MEAHEASHVVRAPGESHAAAPPSALEQERSEHAIAETFRKRVALWVAVLAVLLALTAMGHEHASKEVVLDNIHASDTYNFFQAKNIRQTDNQLAADELETMLLLDNPPEPMRGRLQARLDGYRATIARYESEPSTGEGKKELLEKARSLEASRDEAQLANRNFNYAQVLLQIAIVLGSVAILALHRGVVIASGALAVVAVLLMANGYFALYDLPV